MSRRLRALRFLLNLAFLSSLAMAFLGLFIEAPAEPITSRPSTFTATPSPYAN